MLSDLLIKAGCSHDFDRVLSPVPETLGLDDLSERALPELLLDSICEDCARSVTIREGYKASCGVLT